MDFTKATFSEAAVRAFFSLWEILRYFNLRRNRPPKRSYAEILATKEAVYSTLVLCKSNFWKCFYLCIYFSAVSKRASTLFLWQYFIWFIHFVHAGLFLRHSTWHIHKSWGPILAFNITLQIIPLISMGFFIQTSILHCNLLSVSISFEIPPFTRPNSNKGNIQKILMEQPV